MLFENQSQPIKGLRDGFVGKATCYKPGNLSVIPGTNVEVERNDPSNPSSDLAMHAQADMKMRNKTTSMFLFQTISRT